MQTGDLREFCPVNLIGGENETLLLARVQGYKNLKDTSLWVPVTYTAMDVFSLVI